MRILRVSIICLFVLWVHPVTAVVITPTAIGELLDGGSPPLMRDGIPDQIFPGSTQTGLSNTFDARAFLEFDSSAVPASFTQAILTLGPINTTFSQCGDLIPCPLIGGFELRDYSGDGLIDFSDWAAGSLVTTVQPAPADGTFFMLDVTSIVQASIAASDPFIGFALRSDGSFGAISFGFSSGTHTLSFQVPEPATLLLMGVGLAGLGFARERSART